MYRFPLTFARFVETPENRSALLAAQAVAECVCSRRQRRKTNPLFFQGPTGTGKTHLVSALVEQVTRLCPDLVVTVLSAGDLDPASRSFPVPAAGVDVPSAGESPEDRLEAARGSDLVVLEDLQHLSLRMVEALVQLLDCLLAVEQQVVFTATAGPQQLNHRGKRFPARLASRLAAGLVVRLEPLQAPGRLALLQDRAQRQQLAVSQEILSWLAEHLTGGSRQLLGALTRLETLVRMKAGPLDVATVASFFREQAEASAITVEQIAHRVGGYFQVELAQLQSRCRYRSVLLPRQVGMYLARQLTTLSLQQIGAYFGGRDHSTVLHACRKVEQALSKSAVLSGAVRQLHADLA